MDFTQQKKKKKNEKQNNVSERDFASELLKHTEQSKLYYLTTFTAQVFNPICFLAFKLFLLERRSLSFKKNGQNNKKAI